MKLKWTESFRKDIPIRTLGDTVCFAMMNIRKSSRSTTNSLILNQKMKFPKLKTKSLKDLESLRTLKMKSPRKQKNRDGKVSPNARGEQQKKKMSELMQQ